MANVHIVLIETGSNQEFVFQSNKLREIVGASGLIRSVGTDVALNAAAKAGMKGEAGDFADMSTRERIAVLDAMPDIGGGVSVEPIVCTSGKAVFLVADEAKGKAIVQAITLWALEHAPSLIVRGVVSAPFDLATKSAKDAGMVVAGLFRAIEQLRLVLPPAEGRFAFQPMIEPCRTTGLPAEFADKNRQPLSASGQAKRKAAQRAIAFASRDLGVKLVSDPDALDQVLGLDWLAAVHADGNGFGQVFMKLQDHCKGKAGAEATARDYFDLYRDLSASLDLVGVHALKDALPVLGTARGSAPEARDGNQARGDGEVVPLIVNVMGGDDLTVLCDGAHSVEFVAAYLRGFEKWVAQDEIDGRTNIIPTLKGRFGAAAGIAIVKPHHPVHQAFDLAEELTKSAKTLTKEKFKDTGLSSLDYQVVFGDSTSTLEGLRASWTFEKSTVLAHARPYVVSPADGANAQQIRLRHVDHLLSAEKVIRDVDEAGSTAFPRTQQHALREAVLAGRTIADARLALVKRRYPDVEWSNFGAAGSLYFESDGVRMTRLIDAMELVDIGKSGTSVVDAGDGTKEAAE